MASKYNYTGELALVKFFNYRSGMTKTVVGVVHQQINRKKVTIKLLFPEPSDPLYVFAENAKNPPTFSASKDNQFHILNEERHVK